MSLKWVPSRDAACSICHQVGDGLQHKITGKVLCFVCAWDVFELTEKAIATRTKRARN